MADTSGAVSEKKIESSEAFCTAGVDEWPPKLGREYGVMFNAVGFRVLVELTERRKPLPRLFCCCVLLALVF